VFLGPAKANFRLRGCNPRGEYERRRANQYYFIIPIFCSTSIPLVFSENNIANYINSTYTVIPMKIFFSGPLTNLANPDATKAFYEKLDVASRSLGFDTFWAYKSGTDPVKNPEVTPQEVYDRDIKALDESDLMVSYMGEPSTGTGVEIEHAHMTDKPVVIIYPKGIPVSRMMRGCPAVKKEIVYETEDDAIRKLEAYLSSLTY